MASEQITFEITGSTLSQRSYLAGYLGAVDIEIEQLDSSTFNISVPHDKADDVSEWAEDHDLACRVV